MIGLGDLPGGDAYSAANGVSANGSVIVGQATSASGSEAFRWTTGSGMVGLGDLPGGDFQSEASDVSSDGSVVVGRGFTALGFEAFVWNAASGMRSIREVIEPTVGAALNGWSLQSATAVSSDGRTVVGYGGNPNGSVEAWLAYLPDQILWSPNASGYWDAETSWSGPFQPSSTDDVVIAPNAAATITGPYSARTVRSLVVGGGSTARVTLALNSPYLADLTVTGAATLASNGELALASSRVLSAAGGLTSAGLISGSGILNASLTNQATGEVRVKAGESLLVMGAAHTNAGKIENLGGSLEFIGGVTNSASTGLITGQSSALRFGGGLTNRGALALTAGLNNLTGDVNNIAGAKINVTGGASAVFYDDVVQNGTLRVAKVGSTTSTAVFLGSFTGTGGSTGGGDIFFEGDLRPGNSPASVTFANNVSLGSDNTTLMELAGATLGAEYDHMTVGGQFALDGALSVSLLGSFQPVLGQTFDLFDWGSLSGSFESIALPSLAGGLAWNASQLYTTGVLSIVAAGLPGDYNNDGLVNLADYTVWRDKLGAPAGTLPNDPNTGVIGAAQYATWKSHFGESAPAALQNTAAVPEPASWVLLIVGLAVLVLSPRRLTELRLITRRRAPWEDRQRSLHRLQLNHSPIDGGCIGLCG